MSSLASSQVSLATESCVLAAYLFLSALAGILYFGRKSYKCCLLPFSPALSKSQVGRTLATDVSNKWHLDVLISSVFFVVLLRTVSEMLWVTCYIRQVVTGDTAVYTLDQISVVVLIFSVNSYTFIFCALIWMWLRLFYSLFNDNEARKKTCVLWTVRLTIIGSILSSAIVNVTVALMILIPSMFQTSPVIANLLFAVTVILYFGSLIALCTITAILGIRIAVLIKRTTNSVKEQHERMILRARRVALTKISVAVAAFVLSLIARTVGIILRFLDQYIPSWVGNFALLALPEFITFVTMIVILWPFKVKCCTRFEASEAQSTATKTTPSQLSRTTTSVTPDDQQLPPQSETVVTPGIESSSLVSSLVSMTEESTSAT